MMRANLCTSRTGRDNLCASRTDRDYVRKWTFFSFHLSNVLRPFEDFVLVLNGVIRMCSYNNVDACERSPLKFKADVL